MDYLQISFYFLGSIGAIFTIINSFINIMVFLENKRVKREALEKLEKEKIIFSRICERSVGWVVCIEHYFYEWKFKIIALFEYPIIRYILTPLLLSLIFFYLFNPQIVFFILMIVAAIFYTIKIYFKIFMG